MKILCNKINLDELKIISEKMPYNLVKAVIDVERDLVVIDFPQHADGRAELLQKGSLEENLWGINLYPYKSTQEWIEFYSHINLRPLSGNASRWVEDKKIQEKIKTILDSLVMH